MELERETCRRFRSGDIDFCMDQFAENVALLNPGSKILAGKEHERAALTAAMETEGLEMSWEPTEVHVSASEDMAYVIGIINIKTPDNVVMTEKYVTIYKKIDGQWKLALQIRNSNQ
nr:nuclear transport factor 2 family protein [Limisalsivibrio acetivorans]